MFGKPPGTTGDVQSRTEAGGNGRKGSHKPIAWQPCRKGSHKPIAWQHAGKVLHAQEQFPYCKIHIQVSGQPQVSTDTSFSTLPSRKIQI
ncbi:hypothetical protein PoB_007150400 [Plakobranchus ocellatus]|uniref:Uncharacterized protein n=1 Tax=Plakobranchus ocellatus TaxID=259542 RepID=A0AAV4DLX2_9GAST|nr:hypothetical protein PoB_007150400 [Plakobranchus ocellatus]